jgi:hypothetical protein
MRSFIGVGVDQRIFPRGTRTIKERKKEQTKKDADAPPGTGF